MHRPWVVASEDAVGRLRAAGSAFHRRFFERQLTGYPGGQYPALRGQSHKQGSVPQTRPTEWTDSPAKPAFSTTKLGSSFGIVRRRQQSDVPPLRRRRTNQVHTIKACWRRNHYRADSKKPIISSTLHARLCGTEHIRLPKSSRSRRHWRTLANGCVWPFCDFGNRCPLQSWRFPSLT